MLPDRSDLIGQKLMENAKIQMRNFEEFSNTVWIHQVEESLLIFGRDKTSSDGILRIDFIRNGIIMG